MHINLPTLGSFRGRDYDWRPQGINLPAAGGSYNTDTDPYRLRNKREGLPFEYAISNSYLVDYPGCPVVSQWDSQIINLGLPVYADPEMCGFGSAGGFPISDPWKYGNYDLPSLVPIPPPAPIPIPPIPPPPDPLDPLPPLPPLEPLPPEDPIPSPPAPFPIPEYDPSPYPEPSPIPAPSLSPTEPFPMTMPGPFPSPTSGPSVNPNPNPGPFTGPGNTPEVEPPLPTQLGLCDCEGLSISYTTLQMSGGDAQNLSANLNIPDGCFSWRIRSGLGSLNTNEGKTVIFTASNTTNTDCNNNPTIVLTCDGWKDDVIKIAVNTAPTSVLASRDCECTRYWNAIGECRFRRLLRDYDCEDVFFDFAFTICNWVGGSEQSCIDNHADWWNACTASGTQFSSGPGCGATPWCTDQTYPADMRTGAQKTAGCCPQSLVL